MPPGSKVLVEKSLETLLPDTVKAFEFRDQQRIWSEPDSRINPFSADYILARKTVYLETVISHATAIWQTNAEDDDDQGRLVLLKNICKRPEKCLEPPDQPSPDPDEYAQMMHVKGGAHLYVDQYDTRKTVRLGDFAIHKYEVNFAQYAAFLNEMNLDFEKAGRLFSIADPSSKIVYHEGRYRVIKGAAKLPVFNVSWHGAKAYCEHYHFRLPTTAEWQHAARGKDGRTYPWGESLDFESRANLAGDRDGYRFWAPVDSFPEGASPSGAFNMAGNVYEWLDNSMLMGGSWDQEPDWARTFIVEANKPQARNTHNGFRCARDAK